MSSLYTDESFLKAVMNEIWTLKARWYNLGRELGVPPHELDALMKQYGGFNFDQAFNDVVLLWLRGRSTRTWQALVRAVASETGGDNHPLALEIAGHHRAESKLSKKNCEGESQENNTWSLSCTIMYFTCSKKPYIK